MATPTGYIDETDNGWPVAATGDVTIRANINYPLCPPHWGDGLNPRFGLSMWRQITVPATATLTEWVESGGTTPQVDETDTVDCVYQEYDSSFDFPRQPTESSIGVGNFSSSSYEPKKTAVVVYADATTTACEINAIYYQWDAVEDYDTPEPSDTEDYEKFGDNPAVWSPYSKNRSASAYEAKFLMGRNQNIISYETRPTWSVVI